MNRVSLSELLAAIEGTPVRLTEPNRVFQRVCTDSRQVEPGDLFWAVRGERFDGHDFLEEALRRGAVACVTEPQRGARVDNRVEVPDSVMALGKFAAWYRQGLDALIIGVTGSVGKTTTREMIFHVLSQRFRGTRSRRNFNNELGVPLTLLDIDSEHEFAVVEMGARRLHDIASLCEIARPEAGVLTSIAEAHLETFGTLELIEQAKGELLAALPPEGFGICAVDRDQATRLRSRCCCSISRVGSDEDAEILATEISFQHGRLRFHLEGTAYELQAPGRHFLTSALCAAAVGRQIGMTDEEIARGLAAFHPVEGRANLERIGPWTIINDTYNASPASMSAACELLSDLDAVGQRIFVVGDMLELGAEAKRHHRELGRMIATRNIDRLIAFGTHAQDVATGALDAGMPSGTVTQASEFDTLQLSLDCWLEPGDCLLIKGSRGMRMERVIEWLRTRAEIHRQVENPQDPASKSIARAVA